MVTISYVVVLGGVSIAISFIPVTFTLYVVEALPYFIVTTDSAASSLKL